ncbi:type V CRISPR-associated protein Cas4 [Saccharobesus litoralis]|uniref:Type V CRISPR-associated protein Cas4 n=1 Tax=Saccharobesus litoralis TaxID=2172099 RepID=A0A2S0VW73_9ALTE|nr:type V CRISPR-associated protein Cas4 [Saccharobesus litoralis]AWB68458.1 type V CRISPR-associated protein Cas4 [Saccharobesus litoralis]
MEAYLMISHLNDFIFCPRSIYFHQLYGRMSTKVYHSSVQTKGLNAHKAVDEKRYSTAKHILQGIEVYSQKYGLCGKIDIYDQQKRQLVERKKKIKTVYDGYVFQLFAQYFALVEMGYQVNSIKLYSMDDNKSYPIELPANNQSYLTKFEALIEEMNRYRLTQSFTANPNKCRNCIYNNLCDTALC